MSTKTGHGQSHGRNQRRGRSHRGSARSSEAQQDRQSRLKFDEPMSCAPRAETEKRIGSSSGGSEAQTESQTSSGPSAYEWRWKGLEPSPTADQQLEQMSRNGSADRVLLLLYGKTLDQLLQDRETKAHKGK